MLNHIILITQLYKYSSFIYMENSGNTELSDTYTIKNIITKCAINNTISENKNQYYENLIYAEEELEKIINIYTTNLTKKNIYSGLFRDIIDYCIIIIHTEWDNYNDYVEHISRIKNIIIQFRNIKNNVKAISLPFGNKLPIDIQNHILDINNKIHSYMKERVVDNILNPIIEYLEEKKVWAYELTLSLGN